MMSYGCLLKGSGLQVGNLQVSWWAVRMAFEPQVVNCTVAKVDNPNPFFWSYCLGTFAVWTAFAPGKRQNPNAERDCHRKFCRWGLSLPIPIQEVQHEVGKNLLTTKPIGSRCHTG